MARICARLPDSLVKRLAVYKRQINVSQVCAIALEDRVAHEERLTEMKNGCPVVWA